VRQVRPVAGRRQRSRMTTYPHVAIDGPVASGKTTVARAVAARIGSLYLDTGAMYRAAALLALRAGVDPSDEPGVLGAVHERPIAVESDPDAPLGFRVTCGGDDVTSALRAAAVDAAVAKVAALPGVRAEMVVRQRSLAATAPVVMAGRDIGTVVLPDAPVKIFLTAAADTRAARRAAELNAAGIAVTVADVRAALDERDRTDQGRAVAPLRAAPGATVIDATELSPEDVVDLIVRLVRERMGP